jgi:hypothetical protein
MTITVTSNQQMKEFVEPNDVLVKSIGGLIGIFTPFGNRIFQWCADNDIDADLIGKWADSGGIDISAWRINNEEHRAFFKLYWSDKIWN